MDNWGLREGFKIQDDPGTAEKAIEVTCGGSHIIVGVAMSKQKPGGMKRYIWVSYWVLNILLFISSLIFFFSLLNFILYNKADIIIPIYKWEMQM